MAYFEWEVVDMRSSRKRVDIKYIWFKTLLICIFPLISANFSYAEQYITIGSGEPYSYGDIPFELADFGSVVRTDSIFQYEEKTSLPDYIVDKIHIIEWACFADNVPDGVVVGHVNVYYIDGTSDTLDLVMGVNIAEWAYDRPEVQPFLQHTKILPAYSFWTNQDSDFYYWGHHFYVSIDTQDKPLDYLEYVLDPSSYTGQQYYGYSYADWFGIAIHAITLQMPPLTVTIDGPPATVIYNPVHRSPKVTLRAQADPPGGEYDWEILEGEDKVRLLGRNPHRRVVRIQGMAPSESKDDVVIKVTYRVDGQICSDTHNLTVQKPTCLKVLHVDDNIRRNRRGEVVYYKFTYWFQVADQLSPAYHIEVDDMQVREVKKVVSNNYPRRFPMRERIILTKTQNEGIFKDDLATHPWPPIGRFFLPSIPKDLFIEVDQDIYIAGWHVDQRRQTYYYDYAKSE